MSAWFAARADRHLQVEVEIMCIQTRFDGYDGSGIEKAARAGIVIVLVDEAPLGDLGAGGHASFLGSPAQDPAISGEPAAIPSIDGTAIDAQGCQNPR